MRSRFGPHFGHKSRWEEKGDENGRGIGMQVPSWTRLDLSFQLHLAATGRGQAGGKQGASRGQARRKPHLDPQNYLEKQTKAGGKQRGRITLI